MNPKDAVGQTKPNLSHLPLAPLMETVGAMAEGRAKYSPWNWRDEKIGESIYVDAAVRHLLQWTSGEDIDPDSGISHITKAIAGLLILRDAQIHGCSVDDRGPEQNLNIPGIMEKIAEVHAKYVEPQPDVFVITAADVGRKALCRDGSVVKIETIHEIDKDNDLYPYVVITDEEGDWHDTSRNVAGFFYDEEEEGNGYEQTDRDLIGWAPEVAETTPCDQTTVMGGGSLVIGPEHVGCDCLLRDGTGAKIVKIREQESEEDWPVTFEYLDEDGDEMDETCTFDGSSCCEIGEKYQQDVMKVFA